MSQVAAQDKPLTPAARDAIVADYLRRLHEDASPLAQTPTAMRELLSQLTCILDAIDCRLTRPDENAEPADLLATSEVSTAIGVERAAQGVSPAQSLGAASLIFAATFPVVAEHLAANGWAQAELTAGLITERAIMDRMAVAASSYVDYLLTKVHRSQRDERLRMARDLHDLAAPAVVLAVQNLDLHSAYLASEPESAERRLGAVRSSLVDALAVIRQLSAQSREAVGRGGLRHAVVRYAETVPPPVSVSVEARGRLELIPAPYCEELYLIVREAMRNAQAHGRPQHLDVVIAVERHAVTVEVTDDGEGFDPEGIVDDGSHIGLYSMRERAELLGGQLVLVSAPGHGSRITLTVEFPDLGIHDAAELAER